MHHTPRLCEWEITLACNFACPHCSALAGAPRADELSTPQALDLAAQLAALGCETVGLTGGEPLLRPDWPEIARALTARNVQVSMLTNGWTLDAHTAREIHATGVTQVALSLDGLEHTHDTIRRPGSFDRVMSAIEHLHTAGVATSVTTTLDRLNLSELTAIHDLIAHTPATGWHVLMAAHNGRDLPDFWLQPQQILDVVPALAALKTTSPIHIRIGDNIGYYGRHEQDLRRDPHTLNCWSGCYAGRHILGIESDGSVKGCLSMPSARHNSSTWVEGNVQHTPLADIWTHPDAFSYNRTATALSGGCKSCQYSTLCRGGCRWTAHHHGDGSMDNEYCYHRQLQAEQPAPSPIKHMTAATALSVSLALGGCYESHTIDDSPPAIVTPGPPEALFLPSYDVCDPYTAWEDVVPLSPYESEGISLATGPIDDLSVEDYNLLSAIVCPYELGLDWLEYHPCCMSRIMPLDCMQGYCSSHEPCADETAGTLSVTTDPTTTVLVDDTIVGTTPLTDLTLTPGIHLVTLVNEDEGIHRSYYAMIINCGLTEIERTRDQLVE